jgi:hypothetical protein
LRGGIHVYDYVYEIKVAGSWLRVEGKFES